VRTGLNPDLPRKAFRAGILVSAFVTAVPVAWALAMAASGLAAPQSTPHTPGLVDQVRALEKATIHGDLDSARQAATWLAEHATPAPLPAGTQPLVDRLAKAASTLSQATDVAGAVTATASLVAACGSCHEAANTSPAFPRAAPPALGSIAGHMVRHQDAADRLLEGLIVPSQAAWTAGAGQLREAPLKAGDFPVSTRIGALMSDIESRMHAQADEAAAATDTAGRTRAYGALLARCAECHTRHTTLWDPPVR